jgi:hypothetical protein
MLIPYNSTIGSDKLEETKKRKMTRTEKNADWLDLCEYVKNIILGYDDTMVMPKHLIFRLQGMFKGQFLGNNNLDINAWYDYKTILLTFKFCKGEILQGFEKNKSSFTDENHRINFMMKIIDGELNNVVMRLKKAKKSEEKTENLQLDNQIHETAEYIPKSKIVNKELEELW